MKFNKWTIGLAAVGVVSLASAVKAETANTVYGLVSPNPATWFQQSFKIAPPGFPAIRPEGRTRPPLIMRGPDPGRS